MRPRGSGRLLDGAREACHRPLATKEIRYNIYAVRKCPVEARLRSPLLARFRNETKRAEVESPDSAAAVSLSGHYNHRNSRIALAQFGKDGEAITIRQVQIKASLARSRPSVSAGIVRGCSSRKRLDAHGARIDHQRANAVSYGGALSVFIMCAIVLKCGHRERDIFAGKDLQRMRRRAHA